MLARTNVARVVYAQTDTFLTFVMQKGLKNVFDEAILAALEPPEPPKKKTKCLLL